MIKIAVTGANGRMGTKIIKNILKQDDMELVAALGSPDTPLEGKDVGEIIGVGNIGVPINGAQKLSEVLKEKRSDVLVDFTRAHIATHNIKISAECGVNVVVGTTGLTDEQLAEIREAVEKNRIKAVISPNMAIGRMYSLKSLKIWPKF